MRILDLLYQLFLIFIIILIGTLFDYFLHGLSDSFSFPDQYFRNKIMIGTVVFIIGFFLAQKLFTQWQLRAIFVSAFVAILLHLRYFFEGYSMTFVLIFLFIHFVSFLIPTMVIFRYSKKL